MTEEELIKEATSTIAWRNISMIDRPLFVRGYIIGAEPREERIAQIEKENAELKYKLEHRNCVDYSNRCNNSELEPFDKWKIKDK